MIVYLENFWASESYASSGSFDLVKIEKGLYILIPKDMNMPAHHQILLVELVQQLPWVKEHLSSGPFIREPECYAVPYVAVMNPQDIAKGNSPESDGFHYQYGPYNLLNPDPDNAKKIAV